MDGFRRHWRLKVIALLFSLLMWIVFHYGRATKKQESPRKRVSSRRAAAAETKVIP